MGLREDLKAKYARSRKNLADKYATNENKLIVGALAGSAINGAMEGYGLGFELGRDDAGQPRSMGWGAVAGPVLLATNGLKQGPTLRGVGLGMTCAQLSDFVEDTVFKMTGGNAAMAAAREEQAAQLYLAGREEGALGAAGGVAPGVGAPVPAAVGR